MAMAATEIDRNGDVALLEIYKSSPDVSMDGSREEHSQILESCEVASPVLTTATNTQASSTASLHDDNNDENDLEDPIKIEENSIPSIIEEICSVDGPCVQCEIEQPCSFRFTDNGETLYVCNEPCIKAYQAEYPGKYTVTRKKYIIEEITPKTLLCSECEQNKTCYFYHNFDGEETYYCSLNCLEGMMADEKDKYAFNLNSDTICIDQIRPKEGQCLICEKVKSCEFSLVKYGEPCLLCEKACIKILSGRERGRYYIKKLRVSKPAVSNAIDKNLDEAKAAATIQREQSFHRRCSQCTLILMIDGKVLTWEAMDFCDERCLERFQNGIDYRCAKCNTPVQHTSLGKYCVRFGYDIRQFCNSTCLGEFTKGLKICCYCQKNISARPQVFLAPVGDKGQCKDFCSRSCVEIFDKMSKNPVPQPVWAKCAVCSLEKATTIEVEVTETASQRLCSNPCFAAFKFANNILPDQCKWCKKYFKRNPTKSFTTYDDSNPNCFCSLSCMTIYIHHTKFMVCCDRCKSEKYNFDMIRRVGNQSVTMCSLNCLSLYQESENAPSSSNGVPPPTLVPPVPSVEQDRVMALAAEQLITLTKSRKRRVTTQSSRQEQHQRNESAKKVRFVKSKSPRSGRKKETRTTSLHVNELAEALDMSDEEADEVLVNNPGYVQRLSRGEAQESSFLKPLTPSKVAVECVGNASGDVSDSDHIPSTDLNASIAESMPNICSAEVGVRPSTSGVAADPVPFTRSLVDYGSDFDSDFDDDEFDEPTMETTTVETGRSRNIPDDEDLDEDVRDVVAGIEMAIDDEADRMNGISSIFNWEDDFETFRAVPEVFSGACPGPVKDYETPYDSFTDIWDKAIMENIAIETNRYARQTIDSLKDKGLLKSSSRLHKWVPTYADELYVFFAVIMYMGIDSRTSQDEYWQSGNVLEMPKFKNLMTYQRYILLNKFLHFVDNECPRNEENLSPKLAKVAPVIGHLNSKFSTLYRLAREISIDESLTLFKGRLSWIQAIRTKAARFGIKSFELCESTTGYLFKFEIYTGKNSDGLTVAPSADLGDKSTLVVLDLLKGLENLGHCVTMDNYYNCPALARYLKSLGFDCLGTLRTNRRHVPNDIAKLPKNVAKGTVMARHCGDVSVVAWKDSKLVTIISTYHNDDTYVGSRAGKALRKPVSVRDYNNTMGGVDLKDQKLSMYLLERKRGLKWYIKMFKRLLNVSIHNAFVMYVGSMRRQNMPTMTHREFRYSLASSLERKHRAGVPAAVDRPVEELMRLRRDVVHSPKLQKGRNNRRRCVVCYRQNQNKLVYSRCDTCSVYMCFGECWIDWHSLETLKGRVLRGKK